MKKLVTIMLALALVISVCSAFAAETDPIRIGVLFPSSGGNAYTGNQCISGVEIAREMINARGGVNGRQVEYILADASDATAATTEANRLIAQEGVKITMGSQTSGNALAVSSVTEKNGVFHWECNGVSDAVTNQGYQHVFRTCDMGSMRGETAMNFVKDTIVAMLGKDAATVKVGIVYEDSAFGTCIGEGAVKEAEKLGLNVVIAESYDNSITDMTAMVMRIKQADPDAIFAVSYVNDAILFYDTLEQLKAMPECLIGGGNGYTERAFKETLGDKTNGIFAIDMPQSLDIGVFEDPAVKAVVEEFRAIYAEKNPNEPIPSLSAECCFTGAWILLNDVLPNVQNPDDIEQLRAAATAVNIPETTMGYGCHFDENGQNRGAQNAIMQWQGATTVVVAPEKFATAEIINIPYDPGFVY